MGRSLESTLVGSSHERYEDFWQVTEQALRFAVRRLSIELSRDAKFLEKLTDVVGLYLNPPDKAIVPEARRFRGVVFD